MVYSLTGATVEQQEQAQEEEDQNETEDTQEPGSL
jgi:hypothetical protein